MPIDRDSVKTCAPALLPELSVSVPRRPKDIPSEAVSKMYASRMYLHEAASFVWEGLFGPMYKSVTWLLNQILGHFIPYVGIGSNYPLMRVYQLPPWEPDCSVLMDWLLVVILAFLLLYSMAITFIIMEARRAPDLADNLPEDNELPITEEDLAEDPPEERGSRKLEDFWYPVEEGKWRCDVKFVLNGYEKVFYVYSDDVDEMKEILQNGLPDYAVNGVFQYMYKHVILN